MSSLSRRALIGGSIALVAAARNARAASAEPSTTPAPVLYVSHGAPVFAVGDPARIAELQGWGATLAKPKGIVVVTPHFGSRRLEVGATGRGFAMFDLPPAIKRRIPQELDYPTPPSTDLAARLDGLLGPVARTTDRRGFDHTTWMPLLCLFPAADVPVLELAYPYQTDAELFALGRRLAPLRDDGVLFVASGGMTHNLASVELPGGGASSTPQWSKEFDAWATERVVARDVDALVDWRLRAPAQALAHPDDGGHYRVLLIALGVALGARTAASRVTFPVTGFESTLSKRSVEMA
jgi:4,5-DOPA dioxygenase extradiol